MKKFGFLIIPIVIFLVFMLISNQLFLSGAMSPTALIVIGAVLMLGLAVIRPKNAAPKPAADVEQAVMGDYARDAFADDPLLRNKLLSAMKDYGSNMPKAALGKLAKLAPQCRTDEERYAVAMASALCHIAQRNYEGAILEYNKAVILNPTSELATTIGSCQQRLGQLTAAKDSYEFALDLDSKSIEARSSLATVYVAQGKYETALEHAMMALKLDENHASSLATCAICHGVQDETLLYKHYLKLAVENGYSEEKIKKTVSALKK